MHNIEFRNQNGSVLLCGGEEALLRPLHISGLALPQADVRATVFQNIPGQTVYAKQDKARTIQITGHVYGDYHRVAAACRLLYEPGVLIFRSAQGEKCIDARCTRFFDKYITENGLFYGELTFVCDFPYFRDLTDKNIAIYSRKGLLSSTFTLPCKISERITEGICENSGEICVEPTLEITNHGEKAQSGFTVVNHTTGVEITATATVDAGDRVVISVANRTIENGRGENLLNSLTDTSCLSAFTLKPGTNLLQFSAKGDLRCRCRFNVRYVEGIM